MNILFLITKRQTRGAETFAIQLADTLQRFGHRVFVAALYRPTADPIPIPGTIQWTDLSQENPTLIPSRTILKGISQLIRAHQIDLVQANASDTLKYAVASRILYRWTCPIVYRNASIMSAWIRSPLHRKIYAYLLQSVDAVASVSAKSKEDMIDYFGLDRHKVVHLSIAVHPPQQTDPKVARALLGDAIGHSVAGEKILLHIGAFTAEKNHRGLLAIFERIQQEYPGRVRLISIGNGPLMEEIVASTKNLLVSWLGYRTDVPQLLPAADLLLLPSHIEGTPGVVLEAGINGVVPVAYLVGAVDECYPAGLLPLLTVPAGDEVGMAARTTELLADPKSYAAASRQLRAFVELNYGMEHVGRQFERLFHHLTGLPPNSAPRDSSRLEGGYSSSTV